MAMLVLGRVCAGSNVWVLENVPPFKCGQVWGIYVSFFIGAENDMRDM